MNDIAEILGSDGWSVLRKSKGSTVYHALKRAIILSALDAGDSLTEQQIAGAMGCSQGTVREALMRLEQDGLVMRRGYQGTVVSDTTAEEAAKMARIRIDIETAGIQRATLAFKASDLDRLEDIAQRMEEADKTDDSYARSDLDRRFHLTIFEASGLRALEPILTRCALHMHRFTFQNDIQMRAAGGPKPGANRGDREPGSHPGRRDHARPYRGGDRFLVACIAACDERQCLIGEPA
jgi:DNA-binding GntR family transcriptional regulator